MIMNTLLNGHRLGAAPAGGGYQEKIMANEAAAITKAIETLGQVLGDRLDDLSNRQTATEESIQKVLQQQAEDRGRDVNPRLHDHEMRLRKTEHFNAWILGLGAGVGLFGGIIGAFIVHLLTRK